MAELSDDELLAELGISLEGKKVSACTPREERIIAGFGVSRGFARSMKGARETRVNPGSRGGRARIGLKSYTCDDLVIASPDSLANLARRQAETPLTALFRSQGSQLSGCGLPGDDQLAALALVEGGLPIDRAFPLRSRGGLNVVVGEHLPANEVRNLLYGSNGRSNTNGTLFLRAV